MDGNFIQDKQEHRNAADAVTFTSLYNNYQNFVWQQVFSMTRSAWHADEIVQEVFMRVWIHREKLAGIKNIKSWLFIVTRRIVFDYVVRLSRKKHFLATYKRNASESNNDDALLLVKCRRLLAEAEQQLSPRQKQVYHLSHVKGIPKKQIAEILSISEFTAINHIKKSNFIVKSYVMARLEMEERKIA